MDKLFKFSGVSWLVHSISSAIGKKGEGEGDGLHEVQKAGVIDEKRGSRRRGSKRKQRGEKRQAEDAVAAGEATAECSTTGERQVALPPLESDILVSPVKKKHRSSKTKGKRRADAALSSDEGEAGEMALGGTHDGMPQGDADGATGYLPSEIWMLILSFVSLDSDVADLLPLALLNKQVSQILLHSPSFLRKYTFASCDAMCLHASIVAHGQDGALRFISRCAQADNAEALFFLGVYRSMEDERIMTRGKTWMMRGGVFPDQLQRAIDLRHPNAIYISALLTQHKYTGTRGEKAEARGRERDQRKRTYLENAAIAAARLQEAAGLRHLEACLNRDLEAGRRNEILRRITEVQGREMEALCWTGCFANRFLKTQPIIEGRRRCKRDACGFREGLFALQLRQRCARCRGSYYCSAACQLIDWPLHMNECVEP